MGAKQRDAQEDACMYIQFGEGHLKSCCRKIPSGISAEQEGQQVGSLLLRDSIWLSPQHLAPETSVVKLNDLELLKNNRPLH